MAIGGLTHAAQFARHRPEPIRQASLMMLLAACISDSDALMSALRSLANESSGSPWSDRVTQLSLLLEQGLSLGDAAARVEGLLPEESIIAIRIAENTDGLEATLADEANRLLGQSSQPIAANIATAAFSILAITTAMTCIVTFILVFIIPKFKEIFEGFEVELPEATVALIEFGDSMLATGAVTLLPTVFSLVAVVIIGQRIQTELLRDGRTSWLEWMPRFRTPTILRLLALTTASGSTIAEGLRIALSQMTPSRVATAASHVRYAVSQGEPLTTALKSARFLNAREHRFLEAADRNHHLDWALRHLAASIERRRQMKLQQLSAVLPTTAILACGAVVGFVVIAMYLPLVTIIENIQTEATP
jgi:type IV pilus assembly protein PilC